MPHEFQQLEDAALSALAVLRPEGLRTLATYAGELEAAELAQVTRQFPCIYAIAGGMGMRAVNRVLDATLELVLIVGDRDLRNHTAAARGDAAGPGVYTLLSRCREILDKKPLVQGFSPFRCTGEYPLAYRPAEGLCIYTATYRAQGAR